MKTPIAELFEKYGHLLPDVENEYLEKEKKLLHHHTITDTEIERMAKEYAENENSAYTNDYYGFIAGAKAVLSMMPQSEGWVKVEVMLRWLKDNHYLNETEDTLNYIIDNWQPIHPPKNK